MLGPIRIGLPLSLLLHLPRLMIRSLSTGRVLSMDRKGWMRNYGESDRWHLFSRTRQPLAGRDRSRETPSRGRSWRIDAYPSLDGRSYRNGRQMDSWKCAIFEFLHFFRRRNVRLVSSCMFFEKRRHPPFFAHVTPRYRRRNMTRRG